MGAIKNETLSIILSAWNLKKELLRGLLEQEEVKGNCMACGQHGILDRAHIRTKSVTRDAFKDETNLMHFCRPCHIRQGADGWIKFIKNHKHIMKILDSKGWEILDQFGVRKLVRK